MILCIWVIKFKNMMEEKMKKYNIIKILEKIISDYVKEKVKRIIMDVLRNLIEKKEENEV
jgi:hypothetical protein